MSEAKPGRPCPSEAAGAADRHWPTRLRETNPDPDATTRPARPRSRRRRGTLSRALRGHGLLKTGDHDRSGTAAKPAGRCLCVAGELVPLRKRAAYAGLLWDIAGTQ